MGTAIYTTYMLAHVALTVAAVIQARRRWTWTIAVVLVLSITLAYDNAMLALGNTLGEGDLLLTLSWPRFIIHAFVTPISIAVVADQARRLGVPWADRPSLRRGLWGLTAAMVGLGVLELVHLELVEDTSMGLLRYTSAEPSIPIPAVISVIVMIVVGRSVKRTTGWSTLFILGIVAFVGSAAPPIDGMLVLGNLVEIAFVAALLLTEQRLVGVMPDKSARAVPVAHKVS